MSISSSGFVSAQLRKLLPHLIALFAMALVAIAFYPRAFFDGERNKMGDIEHYIATSKEVKDWQQKHGQQILWSDNMFGGMPTFQIGAGADFKAPNLIENVVTLKFPRPINTLWLAMLSAYILALVLGCSPWIALLVAIGYGLSSINILYLSAGHAAKVRAIATMPGVLAGILFAYRRNLWGGAALALGFTTMHIAANHPQMSYYLLYLLVGVAVVEGVRFWGAGSFVKFLKTSVVLAAAGLLALLPSAAVLAPTAEYMPQTTRGEAILSTAEAIGPEHSGLDKDYILQYSIAKGEWLSLLVPDIKGGASAYYWGEQLFSGGAFYLGALLFSLFLMSLVLMRDRLRWVFLAVGGLAIVLSWRDASWLTDFFLDAVPGFAKFRDTKMMLVVIQVMVVVGVGSLLRDASNGLIDWGKKLWIVAAAPAFMLMLFYILPELFFSFESTIRPDRAIEQVGMGQALKERLEIFRSDTLRSFFFSLLAGAGLLAVVRLRGNIQDENSRDAVLAPASSRAVIAVILGLAIFSTVDLFQVDRRYQSKDKGWIEHFDYMYPFAPTEADLAIYTNETQGDPSLLASIGADLALAKDAYGERLGRNEFEKFKAASEFASLKEQRHYRVLDIRGAFSDARTCYFHRNIGGYHGAKLRRYQDLIEHLLTPEQDAFRRAANGGGDIQVALADMQLHSMLNMKYLVFDGQKAPLLNASALGPAWFATSLELASDPDDEMARLKQLTDARHAIVPAEYSAAVEGVTLGGGDVTLERYVPDAPVYRCNSSTGGLLVFSEVHYDGGWSLTVDGEPAELLRVNYLLRAVVVPPGAHEVAMKFTSKMFTRGNQAATFGGLLVLLLLALAIGLALREQWTSAKA